MPRAEIHGGLPMEIGPYADECGPRAVAAFLGGDGVADLTVTAARLGVPIDRPGTPLVVIAHALADRGLTLERWSTRSRGWRVGPVLAELEREREAVEALRRMKLPTTEPMVDVALRADLARAARVAAERDRRRTSTVPTHTVQSWLRRVRAAGHWLLFVREPEQHVMAVRCGAVVAGDAPCYRGSTLADVWRVQFPPVFRVRLPRVRGT
jgi:hypothetical protein